MKFVANFDDAVKAMSSMDGDIDKLFEAVNNHNKDLTKIFTAHNDLAKLVETIRKKHNWLNFVVAGYAFIALIKFVKIESRLTDLENANKNTGSEEIIEEEE